MSKLTQEQLHKEMAEFVEEYLANITISKGETYSKAVETLFRMRSEMIALGHLRDITNMPEQVAHNMFTIASQFSEFMIDRYFTLLGINPDDTKILAESAEHMMNQMEKMVDNLMSTSTDMSATGTPTVGLVA